ncbi:hypothetical protein NPIL_44681, partial [Nephila pilipes]
SIANVINKCDVDKCEALSPSGFLVNTNFLPSEEDLSDYIASVDCFMTWIVEGPATGCMDAEEESNSSPDEEELCL